MKVTNDTSRWLRARREFKDLSLKGYIYHEIPERYKGTLYDQIIVDVKISRCGKYVWTKIGDINDMSEEVKNLKTKPEKDRMKQIALLAKNTDYPEVFLRALKQSEIDRLASNYIGKTKTRNQRK